MTWPIRPLEELADGKGALVDGPFGSNLKASEYTAAGVPIIRLQNIRPNFFLSKDIKYVSSEKAAELSRYNYKAGDLVIAKLGDPCGMTCVIPDSGASGIIVADVVRFRGQNVDHRFLSYYLNSPNGQAQFARRSKGATRQRVNLADIKEIHVPVPALDEQRRIVDLLSRAENIVRMRRDAEAKAKEIIPALFMDMFGDPATNPKAWEVARLGDIADVVSGVAKGRKLVGKITREVRYLRVANVQAGGLDLAEMKHIPATADEIAELSVRTGDVLLTEGGDFDKVGRGALLEADIGECIHQNHVFRVRTHADHAVPEYFAAYLQTFAARQYFLKAAKKTSNLASINMTQLKNLPLPLPRMEIQRTFQYRFRDCRALEQQQTDATVIAGGSFQALLAGMFSEARAT